MNEAVKKKWLEALRSGEYEQCTERLHKIDDGFCCLGVLCDLYMKETGEGEWIDTACFCNDSPFALNTSRRSDTPPRKVLEWAGFRGTDTLVRMNDNGSTFEDIADYIEETR